MSISYEAAYDAFGGKEGTEKLLEQLRSMGLSEDTINTALTPYFKTTPSTPAAITTPAAVTPPATTQTFSDQITSGPGTTQDEFMSLVSAPASTVVGGTGNDTVVGAAADNITRSGLTGQAGQMVVEGDDIETQIAQLPTEYAHWSRSADQRTMELIRKSDGAVLDRRTVGDFSDLDLAKIGLSFIPGAGQILAGLNVADAVRRGDLLQAAIGVTGLMPGAQNVNTALRVGQAVDSGNTFGALTALAGNTDLQNLTGLNTANVGGFTAKDVMAAGSLTQAALAGNTAGVLTSLGTLAGSSDTVLAGKALGLITRIQNGDVRALGEAMALSNGVSGGGSTGSTTVGNFEDTEVTRLKGLGYTNKQIQDYLNRVDNLTSDQDTAVSTVVGGAGNDVTLPGGVQLASTGDGVFRTDVGGTPIFAESKNAGTVTVPFGYTLLSSTEADNKPEGAYYDITANAWFKPSTDLADLTGGDTIKSDADLFTSSLGDLDRLDNTDKTTDDFADFLKTIGITNTTQLADSGLSNQDILAMINALDDTVSVTGGKGNDSIAGGTSNDSIKGGTDNDNIETVSVTGGRGNDVITGGTGNDVGTLSCPAGKVPNEAGTECIDAVVIKGKRDPCPAGTVYDEDLDACVTIEEDPCPDGYHRDESGQCVQDECPDGYVRNLGTGACEKVEDDCPTGYSRDEITGQCILDIEIVDKKCPPGQVYDEDLKFCVDIKEEECPDGYHRDESGVCVQDECPDGYVRNLATGACEKVEDDCPTGYHRDESGVCVIDDCPTGYHRDESGVCVIDEEEPCPEGYSRDELTGKCIPDIEIKDKKCPPGQVYDEDLKFCVDIKDEPCPTGFYRDESGTCVLDECPEGYVRDLGTGECVLPEEECPTGYHRDKTTGQCVIDDCPTGYHRDESGVCVPDDEECPTGYHRDESGVCVQDECPDGYVRDLTTGECVLPQEPCPEGFERDELTGECIPVIEIEACKDGKVRDPITGLCVFPPDEPCAKGYHRDETTGLCVPDDDDKCETGYEKVNGTCVPVCQEGYVRNLATGACEKPEEPCPEGFERDELTGKCIPVITIEECKDGKVRDPITGLCVFPPEEPCAKGYHRDETTGLCVPDDDDKCETGYEKVNGTCVPVCKEGYVRNLETGACEKAEEPCAKGYHRDASGLCVPDEEEPCAEGYHRDEDTGLCVLDDDPCDEGYHRENGVCVPDDCPEGYLRNLDTGKCEKIEDKECPIGQVRNAQGKCVPITKTTECDPGYEKVNGVCVPVCQTGYQRVDGVCKKITTVTPSTYTASSGSGEGEKTDPIYATGMDNFDLFATLEELLAGNSDKKDNKKDTKKSKEKTKMASGGYLDDLLAEPMTVDDLLKLLR